VVALRLGRRSQGAAEHIRGSTLDEATSCRWTLGASIRTIIIRSTAASLQTEEDREAQKAYPGGSSRP
jgi:hypothetical protein